MPTRQGYRHFRRAKSRRRCAARGYFLSLSKGQPAKRCPFCSKWGGAAADRAATFRSLTRTPLGPSQMSRSLPYARRKTPLFAQRSLVVRQREPPSATIGSTTLSISSHPFFVFDDVDCRDAATLVETLKNPLTARSFQNTQLAHLKGNSYVECARSHPDCKREHHTKICRLRLEVVILNQ